MHCVALEQNYQDVLKGLSELIQKAKTNKEISESERDFLQKAKEICELEINNLWDQRDSEEFLSLCATCFDITVILNDSVNIMELFKIIIFGYLGERLKQVKDYPLTTNIKIPKKWDERLLYTVFNVLYCLAVGKDTKEAIKKTTQLREEQKVFESDFLRKIQPHGYKGAEVVSLYHFVKTVELLALNQSADIKSKIEYHIRTASEFAELSRNIPLLMLYRYFSEFCRKYLKNLSYIPLEKEEVK